MFFKTLIEFNFHKYQWSKFENEAGIIETIFGPRSLKDKNIGTHNSRQFHTFTYNEKLTRSELVGEPICKI